MIHRKVFDKIGLLNEEYGVGGGEDTEFCIEAERAGFKVLEVLNKEWGEGQYIGDFPIYHKGEGTMHDANLVPGWDNIFITNSLKLAYKYGDKQAKDELSWMRELNEEANEHFNEVVTENIYGVNGHNLKDREVIDIGANIGTFSIFASKLGAKKVISVEPVSATVELFKNNIEKAQAKNIVVNQNIASNKSGNMFKIALHNKTGHNSVYNTSDNYEEIPTISFKDLLAMAKGDNIFVKMDCEGGEYDILLNADFEDMQRISAVALEIHGDLHPVYKGIDIIENKLKSFGLKCVKQNKIGCWDGVDQFGNLINYRDLNLAQQIWVR
jgi:FkbM family methyltransferase